MSNNPSVSAGQNNGWPEPRTSDAPRGAPSVEAGPSTF